MNSVKYLGGGIYLIPKELMESIGDGDSEKAAYMFTSMRGVTVVRSDGTKVRAKPMQSHEERVIKEKRELDEKLVKLVQFITASLVFKTLDEYDRMLLREQRDHMMDYSDTLERRISRFKT